MYDEHRITSLDDLRTVYRRPSEGTRNKERPTIDEASRQFIERSRFAAIGTFDSEGNADVSPRGGTSGYVRVLDPGHLAIADLGGNNRLDTLQNIVATGRVGCIFVVPGQSETVRVNGAAFLTTDPQILDGFDLPRVPKAAIIVQVETTYMHCAKAFHRSGMWDPAVWQELADVPDGAAILSCQKVADFDAATLRKWLDDDYATALREENSAPCD